MYSICLSASEFLSCIISNTYKNEFSSTWKWSNDVMNHVDCVIKHIYLQKMHSCSKNINGISVLVLKIYVVYKKKNLWVILHGYSHS